MKKQILNLGRKLSRVELQKVNGGGTCAYYNGQTGVVVYGLSSSEAQGSLAHASDHWCCESCSTATWYNSETPNGGNYGPLGKKPLVILQ